MGDKDRGAWCLVCKKIVLLGGTFSNIVKHPVSGAHKDRARLSASTPSVAAMLASPAPVSPSSEDAKLNARAVLALSAVRLMPKGNIAEAYGAANLQLAARLSRHCPVLTEGGSTSRAITRGYEMLREEMKALLRGKAVALLIDEANSKLSGRKKPLALVVCSTLLQKPILVKLFWSLADDALETGDDAEQQQQGEGGHRGSREEECSARPMPGPRAAAEAIKTRARSGPPRAEAPVRRPPGGSA